MHFSKKMKVIISHYGGITNNEDGSIPWYLKTSPDIQFFKQQTLDTNVIMGSKTFDLLGRLPDRQTIVISKNKDRYKNEVATTNQLLFVENACLIGGKSLINSYVSSGVLNPTNCIFYLTEYRFIENSKHIDEYSYPFDRELFPFITPIANVFSSQFIHPKLGLCMFDVNMYELKELEPSQNYFDSALDTFDTVC